MGNSDFDEARLWQILGGIQADVATVKENQRVQFTKLDTLATKGCAVGEEQTKVLEKQDERITNLEQGSRVDDKGNVILGDSILARTSRRHVLVAAGAGAGAGGVFLLLQTVLDFFLKLHGK